MRSGLVSLARGLRRSETAAEGVLWRALRGRRLDGWRFKRQVPFGNYILDFFCYDARLAIEVDGATHSEAEDIARDAEREAFLKDNGVKVLRFTNLDVQENLDGVLEMIYAALGQQSAPSPIRTAPSPRPSPQGERGKCRGASGP